MKKILLFIIIQLMIVSSFALDISQEEITCSFKDTGCDTSLGEKLFFNVYSFNGTIINSNILLSLNTNYTSWVSTTYNKYLCCRTNYEDFSIEVIPKNNNCIEGSNAVMLFSDDINARASIDIEHDIDNDYYNYKLCAKVEGDYSDLYLTGGPEILGNLGYKCLYRTSNSEYNGEISECGATFNHGDQYGYAVWAKLLRNPDTLNCNDDCTDKTDSRVYLSCKSSFPTCVNVPAQCDGILLNTWIVYDETTEILCQYPWNTIRNSVFTSQKLEIDTASDTEGCDNLVRKEYDVLYQNQHVTMIIAVCED